MKLVIGSDHAGFALKEEVRANLAAAGHEVVDLGACTGTSPRTIIPTLRRRWARRSKRRGAARNFHLRIGRGRMRGGEQDSGNRAGICHDTYSAHQGVEHDDMNVLVLGARIIGSALAFELAHAFIGAKFQGQESRFERRFKKVLAIEAKYVR